MASPSSGKHQLKSPTVAPSAFVHPAATIIGDVHVGELSSIWPGAVLRGGVGKPEFTAPELHGHDLAKEDCAAVAKLAVVGLVVIAGSFFVGGRAGSVRTP